MKRSMKISDKNIEIGIDIGTSKTCCLISEIKSEEESNKILGVGNAPSQGIKEKGQFVLRKEGKDRKSVV